MPHQRKQKLVNGAVRRKSGAKIVDRSRSHYFIDHHNVLFYGFREIVGSCPAKDE
jgi:hypothetical protein